MGTLAQLPLQYTLTDLRVQNIEGGKTNEASLSPPKHSVNGSVSELLTWAAKDRERGSYPSALLYFTTALEVAEATSSITRDPWTNPDINEFCSSGKLNSILSGLARSGDSLELSSYLLRPQTGLSAVDFTKLLGSVNAEALPRIISAHRRFPEHFSSLLDLTKVLLKAPLWTRDEPNNTASVVSTIIQSPAWHETITENPQTAFNLSAGIVERFLNTECSILDAAAVPKETVLIAITDLLNPTFNRSINAVRDNQPLMKRYCALLTELTALEFLAPCDPIHTDAPDQESRPRSLLQMRFDANFASLKGCYDVVQDLINDVEFYGLPMKFTE